MLEADMPILDNLPDTLTSANLGTLALIVSAHPFCARKFTFHVMNRARGLSARTNNDRADGNSYSFDWI